MSELEQTGLPDFRNARRPSKVYSGACVDGVFTVTVLDSALPHSEENPRMLVPDSSRALKDCSGAFCWAREDEGSLQLALALLLDVTGETETALEWHEMFCRKYVQELSDTWTVPEIDIALWLYCFENSRPAV
ncbi:MAG: hypothetical protein JW846_10925 [Dehalococcoidia bacterium]|nr:hypothetical protein [Dehalococcoidia bacterium]